MKERYDKPQPACPFLPMLTMLTRILCLEIAIEKFMGTFTEQMAPIRLCLRPCPLLGARPFLKHA